MAVGTNGTSPQGNQNHAQVDQEALRRVSKRLRAARKAIPDSALSPKRTDEVSGAKAQ